MTDYGMIGRLRVKPYRKVLNTCVHSGIKPIKNKSYRITYCTPHLTPKIGTLPSPILVNSSVCFSENLYGITEVVAKLGTAQALKVRLYLRDTGQLLIEKISEENGVVTFSHLNPTLWYTLVILDPENIYNADILDLRLPLQG